MADLAFTPETRMLVDGELIGADDGSHVRQHQPGHRRGARPGCRCLGRRDAACHRRGPSGVRRDGLGNEPGSAQAVPASSCTRRIVTEAEALREELIAEVGSPRAITYMAQLDGPLADALLYPARLIDEFAWERDLPDSQASSGCIERRAVWKEPMGVVGAITPWNYPFEVTINKVGQILATGNTMVLKPAPDTPWNATRLGRLDRREDRHPRRGVQRRDVVRPPRR